ncbi:MAG TPA: AAA family ATPase, partial [Polyangiales bacterium]|nr:AAA family ATPase [Polyangiales bacterium]
TARKQLLSLARGDGQTLLIEGGPGSGRSRMLDAAVLEGKMLGAIVLRGHAADGGDWSVARSLIEQLMPSSAEKVDAALRLSRDVLAHVVEGLGVPSAPTPDRSLLIRELRDLVLALAQGQRLLIAVDDADRIDEPSLALLAALAHKTERHPLVLALSTQRYEDLASSASLRLLASLAERIELTPLSPSQSEQLLRSVFGEVPNLPFVAAHIQRLAQGNPRAIMELAEHLVERGLCRYEGGSWSLPRALNDHDLPSSLADALESRLRLLSGDARALCEAASIAELPALSAAQFAELNPGWPAERVFAALHELVCARVLSAEVEHYRFTQRGYVSVARGLMSDARKKALHGRMADLLRAREAEPVLLAHHLLEAERAEEAIAVLGTLDSTVRRAPSTLWEAALAHAERQNLPRRVIEDLRGNLLSAFAYVLDPDGFARVAPLVVARLCADSGLTLYRELSELPESERLSEALARTQQRFLDTPEHERGYAVQDAIRKLARISMSFSMVALWTGDPEFLRSFPDLTPLSPLSPAIGVMRDLWLAASHWQVGRFSRAHEAYEAVLARVEQPDRAGLPPAQQELIATVCVVMLGTLEAPVGIARCEQRAQRLENDRSFRISAWRIRQLFHLSRGDMEQAKKCMRRAELLRLQEGIEQVSTGGTQGASMVASVRSEDLVGIEHAIVEVAALAQRMPYWQTSLRWGESARLRLRGDPQAALDVLLPALDVARPGVHWMFGMVAAAHVQLLNELGRLEEAIERGY